MTLDVALDKVVRHYELNELRWIKAVRIRIRKHLLPGFGPKRELESITRDDLEAYALRRRKGNKTVKAAANSSINRDLAILQLAFRLVHLRDAWDRLDWTHLREAKPRSGFFEKEEIERLLACFTFQDHRDVALFMYLTGWRNLSEAFAIVWPWVNWEQGSLTLPDSKNGDPRILWFGSNPALLTLLKERSMAAIPGCPYVFHRNGRPIKSMYTAWRGACRRAGLRGRLMHDFRRTAVRNLTYAGVPRKDAREITGHRTDKVFERYHITDGASGRAAMEKLATFLSDGGKLLGPRA